MQQFQEFPKWVNIPGSEHGGIVVFSKEEEEKYLPNEPKKRGRPKKEVTNGDQ